MDKEQITNAIIKKEEFDRSICMSFFNDHRKLVHRIERLHGIEMAYKVQNAIIDYGLDGRFPVDETILQYVPEPILNQIDQNQKRRSKGFQGEDLEASRSIILLHRDRPELSQNGIAKTLHISKGKVNKTLQKYANGEYNGILNLDGLDDGSNYTNTITITSTNTSMTSDQRDRMTTEEVANAPASDEAQTEETEFDFKSKLTVITNKIVKKAIDKTIEEIKDNYNHDEMINYLVKEFSGTFYQCDKEAIAEYVNSKLA